MNVSDMLRKYHPSLVSRDEGVNVELVDFQRQVAAAIAGYESAVYEAAKVNPNFTAEATRREQQVKLSRAASELQTAVDKAAQPWKSAAVGIRQEIDKSLRPAVPKTEIGELTALLKAQEIRSMMMQLSTEERNAILRATATAGDPSVMHALQGSIVPLVSEPIMNIAREAYEEATAGDLLQQMELAEVFAESVGSCQRFLDSAARGIADKAGLAEAYATKGDVQKKELLNLNASEKAAFIGEHGLDLFKELSR